MYMAAARKAAYGRLVDQPSFEQRSTEKQLTSQVDETKTQIYTEEKESDTLIGT